MSVKRKRMSFCRISSSSSEDGTAAAATESDLSDSTSDSHAHSAGEEEPPTKRKRDKALKTAAERNQKSGRVKATTPSSSPKHSAVQKVQHKVTAAVQDVEEPSVENLSTGNCTQDIANDSLVKNDAEFEETKQYTDRSSEDSHNCAAENTTTDKVDKAADNESVLLAQQGNGSVVDDSDVAGRKECTELDCVTLSAGECLSVDETCHKESSDVKLNCCSAEVNDVSKLARSNTDSECSGSFCDKTALSAVCSEDRSADDEQSVDTETNSKKDDVCENHTEACSDAVTEANVVLLEASKDDVKSDKPVDKAASNRHPASCTKKPRGRPKKANKKSRKKREHSNVTNTASLTEVQETDCEPTKKKKLGRPSKKCQLAQLVAEQCDSLPQSEDDIPLIELRRSARANKGQRNLDQLILEQPKKRNRAKDEETERKRAAKEEKRQKREAELQEQAALKAKKVRIM